MNGIEWEVTLEQSLLEVLSMIAGCEYLSDLHWMTDEQKHRLHTVLADFRTDRASDREWQDALIYIVGVSPKCSATAESAKTMLLKFLKD